MIQGILTPVSCDSVEHYTPRAIVDAARSTLGAIDLDPFSCALANTTVQAAKYYALADGVDGFVKSWNGRVFVNPPGGKVGRESSQAVAWLKLMMEREAGRVTAGVYVCFNLGFLQTSQSSPRGLPLPLDFPIAYPSKRIAYLVDRLPNRKPTAKQTNDFAETGLCDGDSPPNASCIVLVPPLDDIGRRRMESRFVEAFAPMGKVVVPR